MKIKRSSPSEETKRKISLAQKGRIFSDEHKRKISVARIGIASPNRGKVFSEEIRKRMSCSHKGKVLTVEHRQKISLALRGERSSFWRGGVTKKNELIRTSLRYALWREAIFKRDNYQCVFGKGHSTRLHADHIKPFAYFPRLRFSIDNGRTLCENCHRKTDTWGIGATKFYKKYRGDSFSGLVTLTK